MNSNHNFEVIIVGGSYSGLAAAMALGRAMRKVLIIDSGQPCNRQTPYSHNFLTQDGKTPDEIAALARQQVEHYKTIKWISGAATSGVRLADGFEIRLDGGAKFTANKLIFATGISDLMPDIPGYAESWGITVIHCPYCHGYEVRNQKTGILGNGDYAFEFAALISNWTKDLTVYTAGKMTLTSAQQAKLKSHTISFCEDEIEQLEHSNGRLRYIHFKNGKKAPIEVMYARSPFVQHCTIPQQLGCELTPEGYLRTDAAQKTTVQGIFACGDNTSRMRTVANAVAMGTAAGMMMNKELIEEVFI